jgi:hypothetical protein
MEMNAEIFNATQKFFNENGYLIIRNFLNADVSTLSYQYCKTKVASTDFKYLNQKDKYCRKWDGGWTGDIQVPDTYSFYGDPYMDSILFLSTNSLSNYTGIKLIPNYSYWRLYEKGDQLKPHKDRYSCEISATICLGYDTTNLKDSNYNWPMWITDKNGDDIEGKLYPGDIIIYRGCELSHWRERFLGLNHAQCFIHYNDEKVSSKLFDGRPILGIPKKYQTLN